MVGLKQIFTWWNKNTIGTFLKTIFFGKFVGKDEFGNKYYKNKHYRLNKSGPKFCKMTCKRVWISH